MEAIWATQQPEYVSTLACALIAAPPVAQGAWEATGTPPGGETAAAGDRPVSGSAALAEERCGVPGFGGGKEIPARSLQRERGEGLGVPRS